MRIPSIEKQCKSIVPKVSTNREAFLNNPGYHCSPVAVFFYLKNLQPPRTIPRALSSFSDQKLLFLRESFLGDRPEYVEFRRSGQLFEQVFFGYY